MPLALRRCHAGDGVLDDETGPRRGAERSAGGQDDLLGARLVLLERPVRDVDVEQVGHLCLGWIQSWGIPSSASSSRRSLPNIKFAFVDDEARRPGVRPVRVEKQPHTVREGLELTGLDQRA